MSMGVKSLNKQQSDFYLIYFLKTHLSQNCFYLIQKNNPGKVSSFLFLAPLFGVLSGLILLREPVTLQIIIGGFFILLGIFLVNSTESQRTILEKAEVETEGNP